MSSPGAFTTLTAPQSSNDRFLLDRMLDTLDGCLGVGPNAVAMFVYVYVDLAGLSNKSLELIESALELNDDSSFRVLHDFLAVISSDSTMNVRLQVFPAAIVTMQNSPRLQRIYGRSHDLATHASKTLSEAQIQFCAGLEDVMDSEELALQIQGLGKALLRATWLHPVWEPAYLELLRYIPSEAELYSIFDTIASTTGQAREAQFELLAVRVGAGHRVNRPPRMLSSLVDVPNDPVWYFE